MTYFAPYIDSTGIHIPTYQDIVNDLVAQYQAIYGQDAYLQEDSQDYQWISVFASKTNDTNLLLQAVYNSRGPTTAIGSGLDVIVGVNGLRRNPAVYSTCPVNIVGVAGTTITGGIVADVNGNDWTIPSPTIIGSNGTVTVTATCQIAGAIVANPGEINTIVTPTSGWTSVTNTVAATVGSPAESDSSLRARQAISTAQPSQSMMEALRGAIAGLAGVTRSVVYENDTDTPDANGIPANSICAVVEGGAPSDIAQTIFTYKGIGCGTYGTTTVPVTDSTGIVININYDVLGYVDLDVAVTVKQLTGYTSDTTTAIQQAVATYLSSNSIGGYGYVGNIWGAALSANPNAANPAFSVLSVQAAVHLGAQLSTALTSGTAYTSLSLASPLTIAVPAGQSLVIGSGSTTQTVTVSSGAQVGDQTIAVDSFTANADYAAGTVVSLPLSTADIPVAFNQATRGNANYVTVTTQ